MDLLRRTSLAIVVGGALMLAALFPAAAYTPSLLLGLYGQRIVSEDQGGQSALRMSGLLSWRSALADNVSVALYAGSSLDRTLTSNGMFLDSHSLSLDSLLRGEAGSIFLEGGLSGSLQGTLEGQSPYIRPDWKIGGERRYNNRVASVAYSGYCLRQSQGTGDSLFQGLQLGLASYPSVRLRYGFEILGAWEHWIEENSNDLIAALKASTGGLAGYFLDWSMAAQAGIRQCELSGESNLFFELEGDAAWSPHRQVSLEAGVFTRAEIYYLTAQPVSVPGFLSAGIDFRGDWTPNDRIFLVTELSASRSFPDEPDENMWYFLGRLGVEFSL